uniref:Uncharacterized protein n=1 Tax=Arundo donax TaxID=35708 RepID=A0A0A9GP51_ARUDO
MVKVRWGKAEDKGAGAKRVMGVLLICMVSPFPRRDDTTVAIRLEIQQPTSASKEPNHGPFSTSRTQLSWPCVYYKLISSKIYLHHDYLLLRIINDATK